MHSSEIGDCIAEESTADLESDAYALPFQGRCGRIGRRLEAADKEYPPPISWLGRTENLQPHMPWVMKKYCTSDGRLIIKEERAKHHLYFLADRSNGRLVLNLVDLDDAVEESCKQCHALEEKSTINRFSGEVSNGRDEGINDSTGKKVASVSYDYNVMGVKTCGGLAAATTATSFGPPLHT